MHNLKKICHLTSVHNRYDPRIYYKECFSLAKNGYKINLVVADGLGHEELNKIQIIDVGKKIKSRFYRMFIITFKIFKTAKKMNACIYHFHDPELIPYMVILRLLGKKVIYDVHEDYVASILYKDYLPKFLKPFISYLYAILEKIVSKYFIIVLAENCYRKRLSNGITILNYSKTNQYCFARKYFGNTLIYTGNITEDRGAFIYVEILNKISTINVLMIGKCSKYLAERLREKASDNKRLIIIGVEEYVKYNKILEAYKDQNLLAGLILFPTEGQYKDRIPTKIFEYMAAGLPVIASNFQIWRKIIEDNNCGILVNPLDLNEVVNAVRYLIDNPDKVKIMSGNAKVIIKKKYSWSFEELKLLKLYKNLFNEK